MKASELRKKLYELIKQHGDLDVVWASGENPIHEVSYEVTESTDAAFFLE